MYKIVIFAAVYLMAEATSAKAEPKHSVSVAPKHTWYMLRYDIATCVLSDQTPEEFQSLAGTIGHLVGCQKRRFAHRFQSSRLTGRIGAPFRC